MFDEVWVLSDLNQGGASTFTFLQSGLERFRSNADAYNFPHYYFIELYRTMLLKAFMRAIIRIM